MRLQAPDQLSILLLWLSAVFMAAKAGIESWPAAAHALPFVMDWGWLSFVPLALLAAAALRQMAMPSPVPETAREAPGPPDVASAIVTAPALPAASEPKRRKMIAYDHQHLDPNMTLNQAAIYISTKSAWHGDADELVHDIRDRLALGKLPAWGARGPDAAVDEIAPWVWREAQFDLAGSSAEVTGHEGTGETLHRIKLNEEMVRFTWPPRRNHTTGY